ncbi:MAG: pyridoxine 5'-phosphate synthase [Cryobacterium sp.]|nr:pyridoxine 5'-phosphate synthase [Oligoflexia bacterium]
MKTPGQPRLGVNIDHVATLRQLRGTPYPSLLDAAKLVEDAGGEQITVHLREDRRHIQDADVVALRGSLKVLLNLEIAATDEMSQFARKIKPDWVCIVPEKRAELTTEGGLDLEKHEKRVSRIVKELSSAGIKVSLFVEPSLKAMKATQKMGAIAVELHTGRYCLATQNGLGKLSQSKAEKELNRIRDAGMLARKLGLHVHAGHGFDYENVRAVAELMDAEGKPLIEEYNIGHAIICRAVIVGMDRAVREMVSAVLAP